MQIPVSRDCHPDIDESGLVKSRLIMSNGSMEAKSYYFIQLTNVPINTILNNIAWEMSTGTCRMYHGSLKLVTKRKVSKECI